MSPTLFRTSRLTAALVRWRRTRTDRRQRLRAMAMLGTLTDRELRDIGVSRSEIHWLVNHGREVLPASVRGRARQDLPPNPVPARHVTCERPRGAKESSRAA
jgi:uncharacterized protein YjiS (DUF1127 family)